MKKYSAVILSAGYSSRMGSFKPLMDLCGKTPIDRCIGLFKNCSTDTIVVTGYKRELVEDRVGKRAKTVYNEKFDSGMFSSVKAGISKLQNDTDAFFIIPVDIPAVKEHTVKMMIQSFEEKGGIIFPSFGGKTGHPVLIPGFLSQEILDSVSESGLRDVLNLHKDIWKVVPAADRGILMDMDNEDEYGALCKYVSQYPYPDYYECMEMLRLCNVKEDAVQHMKAVADFAKRVALLMVQKGRSINVNAVYSAALLHDIAKGRHNHAGEGARIVKEFGYDSVSDIISSHMEIENVHDISEREIVYISDKLIKGTKVVTLDERFGEAFKRYKDAPEVLEKVRKRYDDAKIIKKKIEDVLKVRLDE